MCPGVGMGDIGVSGCWSRVWVWVCGYQGSDMCVSGGCQGVGMGVSECGYECVRVLV